LHIFFLHKSHFLLQCVHVGLSHIIQSAHTMPTEQFIQLLFDSHFLQCKYGPIFDASRKICLQENSSCIIGLSQFAQSCIDWEHDLHTQPILSYDVRKMHDYTYCILYKSNHRHYIFFVIRKIWFLITNNYFIALKTNESEYIHIARNKNIWFNDLF